MRTPCLESFAVGSNGRIGRMPALVPGSVGQIEVHTASENKTDAFDCLLDKQQVLSLAATVLFFFLI